MSWAFNTWSEFLSMGHYAVYVWSSVGITLFFFLVQFGYSVRQYQQTIKNLRTSLSAVHAEKSLAEKPGVSL